MKISARFFILPLTILLIFTRSTFATDLTIGIIESPVSQLVAGRKVPVTFWVKNINRLDAPSFTLTVTITKVGNPTPVYTSSFQGTNLPKYDSAKFTAPAAFTPTDSGSYVISVNVNYSEDIDHSNDTKIQTFTVLPAPPNLGTRVRQFTYFGPTRDSLSTMGIIEFTVPPQTYPKFLNVLVKRRDTSQAQWLVRNLLFLPPQFTPQNPIGMFVDFKRLGLRPGETIDSVMLCIFCTDHPLSEAPKPDATCEFYHVIPDIYAVGPGNIEKATDSLQGAFFLPDLPNFLPTPTLTDTVERGCTVPNIDLDSSAHNNRTEPGYAGDWNSCAPTSAANSMEWMEKSNPNLIKTGLSLRDKLKEISSFCNRTVNGTTGLKDFIKAKLAFIDKYKLPVKVKFQNFWYSGDIDSPDPRYGHKAQDQGPAGTYLSAAKSARWDWLVKEMKDSEDVEMLVGWWKPGGIRVGGHFVVLTGTAKINGTKQIRLKEDANQGAAGGTHMPSMTWDSASNGYIYLDEWASATDTTSCIMEALVSESPDTSIKFVESGVRGSSESHPFYLTLEKNPTQLGEWIAADVFIPSPGKYRMWITDLGGKEIAVLANGFFDLGAKRYYWDGKQKGSEMPAGVYFFNVVGNGLHEFAKIIRY